MAQGESLANPNSLGDLVPVLHPPNGKSNLALQSSCNQLILLLENLASKTAANAYKHWRVMEDELSTPAHVCVAQLADKTVGVLKVARDGACTFFVRLNRPSANQMADRDKVPRDSPRTFRRELSISEAFGVLRTARPYCLKDGEVHHPHALSLLCSMTRHGWLCLGAAEVPQAVRSFTLVAVTPLSRAFEQCLVLMGWKTAYMPADEALWTAQAVDQSVWGRTHDDFFVGDVASKFADAARELSACAHPTVFTHYIPQLESHNQAAAVAIGVVQEYLHRSKVFAAGQPALAPAPAPVVCEEPCSDVDMAPSDEDQEPEEAEEPEAAPEAAPPASPVPSAPPAEKPASSSSSSQKRRRIRRPAKRDDDDGDSEHDDDEKTVARQDDELGEVVTTDSEDESESGDGGAGGYSDDDDEDGGGGSSSSSSDSDSGSGDDDDDEAGAARESASDSDSQPLSAKPIAKNNEHTPTTRTVVARPSPEGAATATAAAARGAGRLSEAETLAEFARPCCQRFEQFVRAHRALIAPERMALIDADLQLLKTSKSAPGLMGAALSLASNMAASYSDAAPEDAVPVGPVGRKRVRELATRAADFSELTLERVAGALQAGHTMIEQLEDLRKRGRTLLETVESACASEEAKAPAEASQEP